MATVAIGCRHSNTPARVPTVHVAASPLNRQHDWPRYLRSRHGAHSPLYRRSVRLCGTAICALACSLRERGVQHACIAAVPYARPPVAVTIAIAIARAAPMRPHMTFANGWTSRDAARWTSWRDAISLASKLHHIYLLPSGCWHSHEKAMPIQNLLPTCWMRQHRTRRPHKPPAARLPPHRPARCTQNAANQTDGTTRRQDLRDRWTDVGSESRGRH